MIDPFHDGNMRCNPARCGNGKCYATNKCQQDAAPPLAPDLPRIIIAFTGLAGAGKSTAAAHLVNCHGFQRVRFAGPLKAMMAALGLTAAQIDGDEKELPCDLLGGKTPRWAMQSIGTEWGRDLISPDLWIRAWQVALDRAGPRVVVDDARFPNEVAAVAAAGGVCVRVERPGAGSTVAPGHSSEQHQLPAVSTMHNTGAPAALFDQINRLLLDLSWGHTDPVL